MDYRADYVRPLLSEKDFSMPNIDTAKPVVKTRVTRGKETKL